MLFFFVVLSSKASWAAWVCLLQDAMINYAFVPNLTFFGTNFLLKKHFLSNKLCTFAT
jgi:hypothetical protein